MMNSVSELPEAAVETDDLEYVDFRKRSPGDGKIPAIAGIVAGVLPFFASMQSSSTVIVNGVIIESSTTDYLALGGGSLAIAAGLLGLLQARGGIPKNYLVPGIAVALGALQLGRGFGIF